MFVEKLFICLLQKNKQNFFLEKKKCLFSEKYIKDF